MDGHTLKQVGVCMLASSHAVVQELQQEAGLEEHRLLAKAIELVNKSKDEMRQERYEELSSKLARR